MLRVENIIKTLLIISGSFILVSCSLIEPKVVEATVLVPQTVVVTEIVERVVTATTSAATITPLTTPAATQSTQTVSQSTTVTEPGAATPSAFVSQADTNRTGNGEMQNGLTGWCMPLDSAAPGDTDYGRYGMPTAGRPGFVEDGVNTMHIPGEYCTLVFEFSSQIGTGGKVEVKQIHNNLTFYEVELVPSASNPNVGYAHLYHNYIVNPPLWGVTYLIEAVDANGTTRWSGEIAFQKTQPDLCWDGSTPDPVTLWCPKKDW